MIEANIKTGESYLFIILYKWHMSASRRDVLLACGSSGLAALFSGCAAEQRYWTVSVSGTDEEVDGQWRFEGSVALGGKLTGVNPITPQIHV